MSAEHPSPLEEALSGDEDALEAVLDGVVVPLFDLAFHWARSAESGADLVVTGLRELKRQIRLGRLEHPDPLLVAARGILATAPPIPSSDLPLHLQLDRVPLPDRQAALASAALEVSGADLAYVLGTTPKSAAEATSRARNLLRLTADALRDALDEEAAKTRFPRGLVDRALSP